MIDPRIHGAPCWVDLSTPDLAGATEFYRDVLGWAVTRTTTPMGTYAIGTAGDLEVAGMMEPGPEDAGMPSLWTVFFTVDDVDDSAAAVTAAGGRVVEPPFDIPDARIAVVTDPVGAMFGMMHGPQPEGGYLDEGPGSVRWVELLSRDPQAVESFYTAVFGWKSETPRPEAPGYTIFHLADEEVAGMMRMPATVPAEAPSYWAAYFAVEDCERTVSRSVELGGCVVVPPTEVGHGRFAVLDDPAGATFSVLEDR